MKLTSHIGLIIIVTGFLVSIFVIGLGTILTPDRELSETEKRYLTQIPEPSLDKIFNGELFQEYKLYVTDQLFGRDLFIQSYTKEQLFLNKLVTNDVFILEDNWLFGNPPMKTNYSSIDEATNHVNKLDLQLSQKQIETFFALAPHKVNMLNDLYPAYVQDEAGPLNYDYFMNQLNRSVKKVDLRKAFLTHFEKNELQELYFKTDHHWDIDGAFFAYQTIISSMDQESKKFAGSPLAIEDVESKIHKGQMLGSYNIKLYGLIDSKEEENKTFSPKEGFDFSSVKAIDRFGRERNSLDNIYASEADQQEFEYPGLYAGDYSIMKYEKKSSNPLHLLIIKDSYANPITPFLANHFEKTTVLDLRHYQEGRIEKYCIENNVDIVLFLYNDTNITPNEMYEFQ